MIVGTGDIGQALKEANVDKNFITFFASGVSKSSETDSEQYERERRLLNEQPIETHLVYFSSLSIYYSQSRYTWEKKFTERFIKGAFQSYTIVRIGNITFGNNPHTLINFFKNKIASNEPFEIQETFRYLLDKQEFIHWMKMIPVGEKNEMNIPGNLIWVPDLVKKLKDEHNNNIGTHG